MENSRTKTIFHISRNHISLQFWIVKFRSQPIPLILTISREIMQKLASFSLKITKNRENCHSQKFAIHANGETWNHIHTNFYQDSRHITTIRRIGGRGKNIVPQKSCKIWLNGICKCKSVYKVLEFYKSKNKLYFKCFWSKFKQSNSSFPLFHLCMHFIRP